MKAQFSFEESIKEKISAIRRHPSEKVWEELHRNLSRTFHPAFHYPAFFLFFFVFTFFFINISERSSNIRTLQYSALNEVQTVLQDRVLYRKIKHDDIPQTDETQVPVLSPVTHEIDLMDNPFAPNGDDMNGKGIQIQVNKRPFITNNDPLSTQIIAAESRPGVLYGGGLMSDAASSKIARDEIRKAGLNAIQFYVNPSVHYRSLRTKENLNAGVNGSFGDTTSFYIPSSGVEAGLSFWKPVSGKWAIKSGIQVNMSRYEIRSSSNANDRDLTKSETAEKINPSDDLYDQTVSGKKLMNQNFRFSIPVEVEYRLAGNKAMSFFMSGSLQPSFSIYANGSIITSEFKDQIPVDPYLYRRFNVLTGLECFLRLHAGSFDIQAGPQVRYQLLSNNIVASPYREHIMDYSMKIGIIKKIP